MQPETDPLSIAQRMKDRIAKIKEDPGRALFSDFTGTSRGGVSVSVDLLGRLKRVDLRPGTLYEGGELWLISEIMAAYTAAVTAANYLEFDTAQLARELDEAPALKARIEADTRQREQPRRPAATRPTDDEYFDQGSIMRRARE
ncbi:YbaB/EbfC family DNA-binding protein [Actinophytocola sp.]|uniref:YbaB/EbfC family DNA-binding protein n=1 Tax=Actinophytocola sp. TaxID=1872138 RepID=UPI002D7E1C96|nr:YbaB/EbfC family DNA-binding protein [Actinophytocola sp.]HET9142705.1 YbaB/EbfC family DNA-binding protein [Actinophytocola sp.]